MTQYTSDPDHHVSRLVSVEVMARLAIRYLTDEQLIELMTRLECELVARAVPIEDHVLSERPADS